MTSLNADLPSTTSVVVRIVLITITTMALRVCMAKPNPPPNESNRKKVSVIEKISNGLLRPFALCFTFTPVIVELASALLRRALPQAYDIVSGTCAERIAFDVLALAGCLLTLCGMGIRLWCYHELGPFFTFELALLPKHKLITTGPYAFVRHPSYAGGTMALAGMTIVNASRGAWANECGFAFPWWGIGWGAVLGISTYVMIDRCSREDSILHEAFGEKWEAWRTQVRWQMFPGML